MKFSRNRLIAVFLGVACISEVAFCQSLVADYGPDSFLPAEGTQEGKATWIENVGQNHASNNFDATLGFEPPRTADETTPAGKQALSFEGKQFLFFPPYPGTAGPTRLRGDTEMESFSSSPNFSILAVIKIPGSSQEPMTIVGGGAKSIQYGIGKDGGGQFLAVSHIGNIGESSSPVPIDRWTVIGVTYDGKILSFYQDGELADTIETLDEKFEIPNNQISYHIGNSLQHQYFTGLMAALRIYEGALSESDMKNDVLELTSTYIKQP